MLTSHMPCPACESNPGPSFCEAQALTVVLLCRPIMKMPRLTLFHVTYCHEGYSFSGLQPLHFGLVLYETGEENILFGQRLSSLS